LTGYQGLERQLQLGGMSPEEARAAISRTADISGELKQYGAENAPITRRLLANINPEDTETIKYISETMKQMEGAPLEKQINLWIELRENMQKTMTAAGRGEQFEAAWKELAQTAGLPKGFEQVEEGTRIRQETTSPAREQMLKARTEETKEFNKESLKASFYWKDIGQALAGSLLHGLKLNNAVGELNTWLVRARGELETFERVYRETGDLEKALAALDPALAPFVREIHNLMGDILKIGPDIKSWKDYFAESFGSLTKFWDALQQGLKNLFTKPWLEPPPTPTKTEDIPKTPEGFRELQRRGAERRKQEAERKQKELESQPGYIPPEQRDPLTGLPYEEKPAQPQPPKPPVGGGVPIEQRDPLTGLPYEERPLGGKPINVPPPQPQRLPEIEVKPQPQQQEPKTPPWYERKMRGREVPQSEPTPQREPSPFDIQPTPQRPDLGEGSAANPDPNRWAKIFPQSKGPPIIDLRPPGGGPFHSMWDQPTYSKEEVEAAQKEAWKTPAGQAQLKRGKELLAQPSNRSTPLDELGATPDRYLQGLAKQKGWLRGEDAGVPPASSKFAGEKEDPWSSFEKRFGIWPGMGAERLDQTSQKLDQAAASNVNISGAGRISVDVRAPPGTYVDAQGEGFFKSTEITRLTQMLPADMGPLPMTGVGAGQGPSGNGTVSA
jgi:hypothetical protein